MPRPRVLLGIDAGQSVTKAAVYDLTGREVASVGVRMAVDSPRPRWAERDMDHAWEQAGAAVRAVLEQAGPTYDVVAVGLSGHNDGLYAVDAGLRPVRPAILATDSRAYLESARLGGGATGSKALRLTGQLPSPVSPASVLLWLREHEPQMLARTRWALSCKDWLRARLVGEVATDPTDASAAFTDLRTREWSDAALALYGLSDVRAMLPPIRASDAVAGVVGTEAARLTGLEPGTPVVVGAHDVDAAAIGCGATSPGALSIVLGTYSINQVLAGAPLTDPRWQARAFVRPGQWLHMATSPAGAVCLDWAARRLGPLLPDGEPDLPAAVAEAVSAVAADPDGFPLFLPFLYGLPNAPEAEGSWVGLRGEHGRGQLLAAVLEGVAFNHRTHVDALREVFDVAGPPRVCGGGARSPAWTQLLCDVLDLPLEVTDAHEAGARGAALLAGVGTGEFSDLGDAVSSCVRVVRQQQPRAAEVALRERRYRRYLAVAAALGQAPVGCA